MEIPEHPKNPVFPQPPMGKTYVMREESELHGVSPHQLEQNERQADFVWKRWATDYSPVRKDDKPRSGLVQSGMRVGIMDANG